MMSYPTFQFFCRFGSRGMSTEDCIKKLKDNKMARAILKFCNIPIQSIGLSLTQLLLHHKLCDFFISQPILYNPDSKWITAVHCHEASLHQCNTWVMKSSNKYTYNLCPLQRADIVAIQNHLSFKWNVMGGINEVLPDH